MSGKAAAITITEKQQAILHQITQARTSTVQHVQRARVILLAFDKIINREIAADADNKWIIRNKLF